jgi:hypothetical protein
MDQPRPVALHDKADIEAFARQNPLLHLYEIGNFNLPAIGF